jgi:hypothetical protein
MHFEIIDFSLCYFEIFAEIFSLEKFSIKSWSRVVPMVFLAILQINNEKTSQKLQHLPT